MGPGPVAWPRPGPPPLCGPGLGPVSQHVKIICNQRDWTLSHNFRSIQIKFALFVHFCALDLGLAPIFQSFSYPFPHFVSHFFHPVSLCNRRPLQVFQEQVEDTMLQSWSHGTDDDEVMRNHQAKIQSPGCTEGMIAGGLLPEGPTTTCNLQREDSRISRNSASTTYNGGGKPFL